MEIKVVSNDQANDAVQGFFDAMVVGVFEEDNLTGKAAAVDAVLNGKIKRRIDDKDFAPGVGALHTIHDVQGFKNAALSARVILVGLGKAAKYDRKTARKAIESVARSLTGKEFKAVQVFLPASEQVREYDVTQDFATIMQDSTYSFQACKSKQEEVKFPQTVSLVVNELSVDVGSESINVGLAIAHGMKLTKDLGNTPANICTPTYLGNEALKLASDKLKVTVLGRDEITKLGMGSFLSVAQGSIQEPKLIVMQYNGAENADDAPIALVGKGITFDTGGISIKPAGGMEEMKFDMLGAATVLGTFKAASELGIKKNIVGVIPTCENMPSHNAVKPGDVVTSMSGQTIEIINTDAEGRLILCDALTYVQKNFKAEYVIDMATLTGAICGALGLYHTGLFSTSDKLADALSTAALNSLDSVWRMPMDQEFDDQLKSSTADMKNMGTRYGGASSAACFLGRFIEEGTQWAHLDIAGTASQGDHASGRPVPLLVQFLIDRATWG